jgi:hypothetical protein
MSLIKLNTTPSRRELLWFSALWFPLTVGLLGLLAHRGIGGWYAAISIWIAGAGLAATMLIVESIAKRVYIGMSYATYPMGVVMSHVTLRVAYFAVIMPIGLLLRLMRRDSMRRRFDADAASYWQARGAQRESAEYFRQS